MIIMMVLIVLIENNDDYYYIVGMDLVVMTQRIMVTIECCTEPSYSNYCFGSRKITDVYLYVRKDALLLMLRLLVIYNLYDSIIFFERCCGLYHSKQHSTTSTTRTTSISALLVVVACVCCWNLRLLMTQLSISSNQKFYGVYKYDYH